MAKKQYAAIDLKSYYASVEAAERGYDPLDVNLVVADESRTDKTICLAVSPALKAYGISGRARLFEAKQRIKEVNRERRKNAPGGAASKSMFPISVAIEEDNNGVHLSVLGAKPLLDRGYYPFLFRLSKKRNYIPHDETHARVHKGWHRVGQGTDTLHITDSGRVSISITALKHADIDIDAEEENYREEAEWFVNDREKNGLHVASYGNRIIKIQYLTGHEVKSHKVRLLYGIAFSKQKPSPREKFDMSQLVTDIATFHVSTVPYNHGSEYRWVFER